MIDREDMLELTRRMTPARSSVDRIAGAYFDEEGFIDGTFNTNYLNLSAPDKTRQLSIAKAVLFAETNVCLKDRRIPAGERVSGSLWQLLEGIRQCGLKNDAFLDILYELVGEAFSPGYPYSFLVFHGRYDVPQKGSDKAWLEGSEEVYEYLICAVCPISGEYESGAPEFGFLYPAFRNRSADEGFANVFEADPGHPHRSLEALLSRI